MDRRNIPYVYEISDEIHKAAITGDGSKAMRLISEALNDIGSKIMEVVNSYPHDDLPLVMAALLTSYRGLCSVTGPQGKELADLIAQLTDCIAIDVAEFVKQAQDEAEA